MFYFVHLTRGFIDLALQGDDLAGATAKSGFESSISGIACAILDLLYLLFKNPYSFKVEPSHPT